MSKKANFTPEKKQARKRAINGDLTWVSNAVS